MMTNKTTLPKVVLISESPSAMKSHFKFNPLIFTNLTQNAVFTALDKD